MPNFIPLSLPFLHQARESNKAGSYDKARRYGHWVLGLNIGAIVYQVIAVVVYIIVIVVVAVMVTKTSGSDTRNSGHVSVTYSTPSTPVYVDFYDISSCDYTSTYYYAYC